MNSSHDVCGYLAQVLTLARGLDVVATRLASRSVDDRLKDTGREWFCIFTGTDATARAAFAVEVLRSLLVGAEITGTDSRGRVHVRWLDTAGFDEDSLCCAIVCGLGAQLTLVSVPARPDSVGEFYYAGPGRVFGVLEPTIPPVSDLNRAFQKLVRGKQTLTERAAAGLDTMVEVSIEVDGEIVVPFWADE